MSNEFNFTDNKDWLLPFLEAFNKQKEITDIDTFAIKNLEKIFKQKMIGSVFSMFSNSTYTKPWKECAKLYTLQEVAKILKVSEKSVYRYIKSGKLKATKIGQWRIKEEDLNKLIN